MRGLLIIRLLFCLFFIGISINVQGQDDKRIYEQAKRAFDARNFEEATRLCQKYLDFYPKGDLVLDVKLMLAECAFQLRNFKEAATRFENLADLYPDLDTARQLLARAGECFQKIGNYTGAKRVFTKLKNRYPDTPEAEYAIYNIANLEKKLPTSSNTPTIPTTSAKGTAKEKKDKDVKKPKQAVEHPLTEEELLHKAKKSFEAKNFRQALALFREFLNKFKTSKFAHYAQLKVGECLYYQERFQEALNEYKKVISNYPDSKYIDYAIYSIGWCHYRLGNYEGAISLFEKLLKEYPNSKYAPPSKEALDKIKVERAEYRKKKAKELLDKAISLYNEGKYRQAKNIINELISRYPDSEMISTAEKLLVKIDEALASVLYKQALATYERGEKALENKNYNEAIKEFRRVIAEFPESEYAKLAQKAIALVEEERAHLDVKKKWEQAVKLYEEEKIKEARKEFEEIITQYPNTKYKEKAEKKLSELKDKEDDLEAYNIYKKALSLMKEKRYPEAINTFQEILTNYPNTKYVSMAEAGINEAKDALKNDLMKRKFDIAQRYYVLGNYKSAKEWFEEIRDNYPGSEYAKKAEENLIAIAKKMSGSESPEEEYNLALSLYSQKNFQEAMVQFKKIIDKYPNTKFAKAAKESLTTIQKNLKDEKAKALYDDARKSQDYGNYTSAISKYDKLINEYPDSYWTVYAIYGKAETLYAMEEFDQAKLTWQKVVDEFPTSDLVPHALYHIAECHEQTGEYKKAYLTYDKLQKTYPESIYSKGELGRFIKDKIAMLRGKR